MNAVPIPPPYLGGHSHGGQNVSGQSNQNVAGGTLGAQLGGSSTHGCACGYLIPPGTHGDQFFCTGCTFTYVNVNGVWFSAKQGTPNAAGQALAGTAGGGGWLSSVTITNGVMGYSIAPTVSMQSSAAQLSQQALLQMQAMAAQRKALQQSLLAPPPPAKLKTGDLKIGEITGWRGWLIRDGFLRSQTADVIWAPNELMQGNVKGSTEHNGCYAYKLCRDLLKNHSGGILDVYGRVHMWGRVIEHELGYRSEWAKIIGIDGAMTKTGAEAMKDLRKRYGFN